MSVKGVVSDDGAELGARPESAVLAIFGLYLEGLPVAAQPVESDMKQAMGGPLPVWDGHA